MHPPDHLLRALAAVPASSRILDLECGAGARLRPLARLGFEVWACDADEEAVEAARRVLAAFAGEAVARKRVDLVDVDAPVALGYGDASFDWVVACGAYQQAESEDALRNMLAETHRVLKPGGWVYVAVSAEGISALHTPDRLDTFMEEAGLVPAEAPAGATAGGAPIVHAMYRRVEVDTPA